MDTFGTILWGRIHEDIKQEENDIARGVYPVSRLDNIENSLKQTYTFMLSLMKLIEEQQREIEALHEQLKAVESKVNSLE